MKKYLQLNNEVLTTYDATGYIDREKDIEATRAYFLDEVNNKTRFFYTLKEKMNYLVREGYYEHEFVDMYTYEDMKSVFKLVYSYKFRFPSFMSASKFYESYALKDRKGNNWLERYEDRIAVAALVMACGNTEQAKLFAKIMMEVYTPATPSLSNLGKKARGEFVSCFEIGSDDTMNAIAKMIDDCLRLSKLGGGVGANLTDIRCAGDPIKGIENRASGIMPVAKLLENSFSYANQLGQRKGSGVIWLNIFHGDIEQFLSAKKPNADEKIQLATLSTGVIVPDIFMKLMENEEDIYLFSPYDIFKEYGIRMSDFDFTNRYHELVDNPNIRKLKRINAAKLYNDVKKTQIESGYPFEFYVDTANEFHPLKNMGRIRITNLCTEIFQLQTTSIIGDYDEEDVIGYDVSCNLGSIDIHTSTKYSNFEELIKATTLMLTYVSDVSNIKVQSVAKGNSAFSSIGLGTMNLHGHLMYSGIRYGSDESLEFVDAFYSAMNYYSIKASMELAKERNKTFEGFKESAYATGEYFQMYLEEEFVATSDIVIKALGNVPAVTIEMWAQLKEDVKTYGMYNAYRIAIPPTGSISYVRSATASMAPITQRVEVRDYDKSRTIYPAPFLTQENASEYIEAYDMDMYEMIDVYATAQRHIDQGISMTLYITDQWTTEELAKIYIYAWKKGIKSVYYVRQRTTKIEECVSCTV